MPYWLYNKAKDDAEGPHDTAELAEISRLRKSDLFAWKLIPHGATNQREFLKQHRAQVNKSAAKQAAEGAARKILDGLVPKSHREPIHEMIQADGAAQSILDAVGEAAGSALTPPRKAFKPQLVVHEDNLVVHKDNVVTFPKKDESR